MKQRITRARKRMRAYQRDLLAPDVQSDPAREARVKELVEYWTQKVACLEAKLADLAEGAAHEPA